jgi:hypothetical protein
LAFDSQDVTGVIEDLELLRAKFAQDMARAREAYLPLVTGQSPDKAIENALEHFRDKEVRQTYYVFYTALRICMRSCLRMRSSENTLTTTRPYHDSTKCSELPMSLA